jgi:hypothetical protein
MKEIKSIRYETESLLCIQIAHLEIRVCGCFFSDNLCSIPETSSLHFAGFRIERIDSHFTYEIPWIPSPG